MTTRSFVKRLTAFLRYRRATQDMNKRYGDATVEDIEREDTCIICREEMRPWSVTNPQAPPVAPGALPPARPAAPVNERSRPKKLPCGHILHLGCLRSWLERQQVCPTCRRPVVENARAARNAANNANQGGQGARPPGGNHPGGAGAAPAPGARPPGRGMRMLNLGPLRVGFGQANLEDIEALGGGRPGDQNAARVYGLELGFPRRQQPQPQLPEVANNPASIHDHLQQIEQQIMAEIRDLQVVEQELQLVRLLQTELARLRLLQIPGPTGDSQPQVGVRGARHAASSTIPQLQQHAAHADALPIPAGGADLPPGVVIPEGWSLLPLQRMDGPGARPSGTAPPENTRPIPTPTTTQWSTSSIPPIPPITRNPIPRTDPEHRSPSSSDSSDANATHTPPATSDDQSNSTVLPTPETTSIPASSTSAAPATSDSPVLPSWSTSQLFSGPGQATATRTGHENPTSVPDSTRGGFPVDAGQSSSLSSPVAGDDAEETPEQRARGTARAATVEDTIDDADGS
jgi:E3 ubiquitin-protein ligase synoviolin